MTACGGPRRGRKKASPLAAYTAGPRPAAAAGRAAGDGEAAAGEEDLALRQPRNAWGAHDLGQHAPERRERRYRDVSVLWAQSRRELDAFAATIFVPEAGRRLRCSQCGGKMIDARPAWHTR
jgi:hypothetical protein